jgi:hypothetical protein
MQREEEADIYAHHDIQDPSTCNDHSPRLSYSNPKIRGRRLGQWFSYTITIPEEEAE